MTSAANVLETALPAVLPADQRGLRTTEFWTTVGTNVISLVVAVAALFGRTIHPGPLLALVPAVAVLVAAFSTAIYTRSRTSVKTAQVMAAGTALAGRSSAPVAAARARRGPAAPVVSNGFADAPALVTAALGGAER